MEPEQKADEEFQFIDLAPAIEFCCWTVVVLAPFLRFINGAAVTDDQWWIQVFLFTSAFVSACSLRSYQIIKQRSSR